MIPCKGWSLKDKTRNGHEKDKRRYDTGQTENYLFYIYMEMRETVAQINSDMKGLVHFGTKAWNYLQSFYKQLSLFFDVEAFGNWQRHLLCWFHQGRGWKLRWAQIKLLAQGNLQPFHFIFNRWGRMQIGSQLTEDFVMVTIDAAQGQPLTSQPQPPWRNMDRKRQQAKGPGDHGFTLIGLHPLHRGNPHTDNNRDKRLRARPTVCALFVWTHYPPHYSKSNTHKKTEIFS